MPGPSHGRRNTLKRIAILGSTGSIGRQTLEVVSAFPSQFEIVGLAAGWNIRVLQEQVDQFKPRLVGVASPEVRGSLSAPLIGAEGLFEIATDPNVDVVVVGTPGLLALNAIYGALQAGKTVALANKEPLVAAGEEIMALVREHGRTLLPVDSEHSAIWQCLRGEDASDSPLPRAGEAGVSRLILTASGGPFRDWPAERLAQVTVAEALAHPNWTMGVKVTVDSATLLNKGFEIIEARWLFDLPIDQIEAVMHRQSIVHSLVEFIDGSVKAQLGLPDMRMPLQYALMYPERASARWPSMDFGKTLALTFEPIDRERFPAFDLAYQAGRLGSTYPAVLSAADEEAVELFRAGAIRFTDIPLLVGKVLERHRSAGRPTLEAVMESDRWARQELRRLAPTQARI